MFDIFTIPDIKQLVCKRQLRNNMSVLYLIKGVDKYDESLDLLKMYSSKCTEIFYDRIIEKPTFEETNENITSIQNINTIQPNTITEVQEIQKDEEGYEYLNSLLDEENTTLNAVSNVKKIINFPYQKLV